MRKSVTVTNNFPDVKLQLERAAGLSVRNISFDVETQIKALITHPPGGPSPTAQAAGRSGLVDTSNYRDSWITRVDGLRGEVGSPVEYGVYLEYGTRNMPAYPHIVPAADGIRRRVANYFRNLGR